MKTTKIISPLLEPSFSKLLLSISFSCKEKEVAEPLMQYHFLNFTDATGQNLFEYGKINTANLYYQSGNITSTWDETLDYKKNVLAPYILEATPALYQADMAVMLQNDYLLLEPYQGNLESEQVMLIDGVRHTFRYSLKDGFYQNGNKLTTSTDVIDKGHIFLHHIRLEDF